MRNLVFLSGPQGGGKTTLSLLLEKKGVIIPNIETKTISLDTNPKDRIRLKICQRALENFECLKLSEKYPGKIIIGNRCIYDQFAFNEAYLKRGWIKREEKEDYDKLARKLYPGPLVEPYAIILNPGFDTVKEHLMKRWSEGKKKWKEDDLEYIRSACISYESLKGNKKIMYIARKIDLESDSDINLIMSWLLHPGSYDNAHQHKGDKLVQSVQ